MQDNLQISKIYFHSSIIYSRDDVLVKQAKALVKAHYQDAWLYLQETKIKS